MLNIEKAFIRCVDTSPEKVIFVASNQQLTHLASFWADSQKFCIICVDPTFVGPCQGTLKTYPQLQLLTKKGEQLVMMSPAIIHARKEYVSHFHLPSKLIQHKSSLNKIILVGIPAGSKKCKSICEVAEKQENQVILYPKSRGMDTCRDLQKVCNRRHVLPDEHETTRINFFPRTK